MWKKLFDFQFEEMMEIIEKAKIEKTAVDNVIGNTLTKYWLTSNWYNARLKKYLANKK